MRAEKSRKSLKYQKRYLVLLLGGFRESETRTLSLIAKMGAYPSFQQPTSRFPPGFTKFRIAVRVVIAMKRMVFLVRKSKNSIRQVIEPNDPTLQRNPPKDITADLKTSNYSSHKSEDRYDISSYPQVPLPQNVSSRLHPELTKVNDYRRDIRSEPKDISFDGKCTSNTTALDHINQGDSGIYPRYYNNRNETSSSLKFCDATSTGTFLPIYQATSDLTNKPETSNQRLAVKGILFSL